MSHHEAQTRSPYPVGPGGVRRLNWGCGEWIEPGWINSDIKGDSGADVVADILEGLPLETDSIDYAVASHALPEIPLMQLVPTLEELRRVLKPGGVLRLILPDLDRGIDAYQRGHAGYFHVPDEEAASLSGKFIVHMLWFGYSRSLFTHEFVEELLSKAGFARVDRCRFKQTASPFSEIVTLDNREQESLFVEAVK
jgi:predicted SAM-dependent methyltransferase